MALRVRHVLRFSVFAVNTIVIANLISTYRFVTMLQQVAVAGVRSFVEKAVARTRHFQSQKWRHRIFNQNVIVDYTSTLEASGYQKMSFDLL